MKSLIELLKIMVQRKEEKDKFKDAKNAVNGSLKKHLKNLKDFPNKFDTM